MSVGQCFLLWLSEIQDTVSRPPTYTHSKTKLISINMFLGTPSTFLLSLLAFFFLFSLVFGVEILSCFIRSLQRAMAIVQRTGVYGYNDPRVVSPGLMAENHQECSHHGFEHHWEAPTTTT